MNLGKELVRVALVAAGAGMAVPAEAAPDATKANYDIKLCDGGSLQGTGENFLQYGKLDFGWCATGSGAMTTLTARYARQSGAFPTRISVRFGYEWTTRDGGKTAGSHWDQTGSVSVGAGETWGARFRRRPAEARPTADTFCMRGKIEATVDGVKSVYSTSVVC